MLIRYSSEIRTGCANERPSGSVRGAPGNWCPYRDQQLSACTTRMALHLATPLNGCQTELLGAHWTVSALFKIPLIFK
jgi:hypothetical protein